MSYIRDNYISNTVSKKLIEDNQKRDEEHIASGKLSASMLGQPLQWQILKIMGIKPEPFDEYVLRKFQRGRDVEEWLVKNIPDLKEEQKPIEYRKVVGIADAIVNTKNYNFKCGVIPHEIKSVTNAKFKRIKNTGDADRSHILQACLYALALKSEHFAIDYVASDDYRILTYIYKTSDYKDEVDRIIDRFDKQLKTKTIPEFIAEEKWQENPKYNNYPEWMELTQEEINKKYETESR